MQILDETGDFTPQHLQELSEFVETHLLSTNTERDWLSGIVIVEERSNYGGFWECQVERNDRGEIRLFECAICLNTYYANTFSSPNDRIKELKKILAHEYGHHWTLSYLIRNCGFDYCQDRLPKKYYEVRGLKESDCIAFYMKPSQPNDWYRCDKEIIAEDYRCLFAPDPHNIGHQIVEEAPHLITISYPNLQAREFIENMHITYGSGDEK
jgi:hypothetical protein